MWRTLRAWWLTVGGLRRALADTEAELAAERRMLAVAQAEIDSLAAVVARDRERVRAETADAARRIADAETCRRKA